MSLETGLEALLAAFGVEIAKVVVRYLNNKSNNKESDNSITDESVLTDKFFKGVLDDKEDGSN